MSRIESCFGELARQQRKALIPYIVCGDPSLEQTLACMHALVQAGGDVIELGVPFSDPMAEGPVIQKAHERALQHHTSLTDTLDVVSRFRQSDNKTPVVLMGYANPVERMGYTTFADRASAAGVDGVLTVDMPPEEAGEFNAELKRVGMDNIFLLAPTTTEDRARHICELATGYLYYVSLKGVTGAGHLDVSDVKARLTTFRHLTRLPVCVGFGIKDAQSAASIASVSDGVVVGSVLVNKIAETLTSYKSDGPSEKAAVNELFSIVASMRQAIDQT